VFLKSRLEAAVAKGQWVWARYGEEEVWEEQKETGGKALGSSRAGGTSVILVPDAIARLGGRAGWGKTPNTLHRNSSPGCDDIDAGAAIGKGVLAGQPSKLQAGGGRGIFGFEIVPSNIDPTVE
jgi:hypothetical protein